MPHLRARSSPLRVCKRPTAAQGFVELNDCEPPPRFDARERVFSGEELLLRFKNLVIAGFAFLVAVGRDGHGIATRDHSFSLLNALLFESAAGHERVGNLAEGSKSCLLVLKFCFLG